MASVNKVILLGRIGTQPEIRQVKDSKVAQFSLATSEFYKDKNGERKEITDWHNIVCWRSLADIVEKYTSVGSMIYAEGRLKTRKWTNDKGENRYVTEVIADRIQLLDSKKAKDNVPSKPVQSQDVSNSEYFEPNDEDLPF